MDWAVYTLDFTQEGRRRVKLFSYVLGYSRRQYIHFTESQDMESYRAYRAQRPSDLSEPATE